MAEPLLALTLWQPWAFAVASLGKDIENRTWPAPSRVLGKRIAIHAGKKFDVDLMPWFVSRKLPFPLNPDRSVIVATAVIAGCVDASPSKWFAGPFGWLLEDVVTLREPVPCRGAQGLWTVPTDIAERVRAQESAQ